MGSPTSPQSARHHISGLLVEHGFACAPSLHAYPRNNHRLGWATLLCHPIAYLLPDQANPHHHPSRSQKWIRQVLVSPASVLARTRGYGNINPSSIDYACRPRLRPRLTLGGSACPRNPWSFGARVSHPRIATHACILTRTHSTPHHQNASQHARRSPTHHHHPGG